MKVIYTGTPPTLNMYTAMTKPGSLLFRQWPIRLHAGTHWYAKIGLDWVVIYRGWVLRDRGSPAPGGEGFSAAIADLWQYAEVAGEAATAAATATTATTRAQAIAESELNKLLKLRSLVEKLPRILVPPQAAAVAAGPMPPAMPPPAWRYEEVAAAATATFRAFAPSPELTIASSSGDTVVAELVALLEPPPGMLQLPRDLCK